MNIHAKAFTPYCDVLRYNKMKELKNISGYIVNIHDVLNFDIDLQLTSGQIRDYSTVITNKYTYKYFPDLLDYQNYLLINGVTYRCRLRGIGINKNYPKLKFVMSKLNMEVKKLVNRSDGLIITTLADIDIYQRLLVDIYLKIGSEVINLKDYILSGDYKSVFYEYKTI